MEKCIISSQSRSIDANVMLNIATILYTKIAKWERDIY